MRPAREKVAYISRLPSAVKRNQAASLPQLACPGLQRLPDKLHCIDPA